MDYSDSFNPKLVERLTGGDNSYLPEGNDGSGINPGNQSPESANPDYLWFVAMSFFTFKAVNYISWATVPGHMRGSFPSRWKWANTLTSAAHSTLSGVWALLVILWQHPHLRDDVIEGYEESAHKLCCLSVGYFAYDFVDMALYTWHKKSTKEMLVHHLAVGIPFFIGASSGRYLGGIACTLFTEINSIFLHARALLKMSNFKQESGAYRAVAALNLLTYLVFRILLFVWFGNKLWITRDDMPAYVLGSFTLGFFFVVAISLLNLYRLVVADFCPSEKTEDTQQAKVPANVEKIVKSILDQDTDGDVTEAGQGKKTD